MAPPDNQGGDAIDSVGGRSMGGARGAARMVMDTSVFQSMRQQLDRLGDSFERLTQRANRARDAMNSIGDVDMGGVGGGGQTVATASMAGSMSLMSPSSGPPMLPPTGGGMQGGGAGISASLAGLQAVAGAGSSRIARGAQYSLAADRMSVLYQQMYGMNNQQVRQQIRMPLASHYLLGGGNAINEMMSLQAQTGLSALGQASSVEGIRAASGFAYGTEDVTAMLKTMATPEVANRMFMMGGTGMYGIGGQQRGGMQVIQDIVRRTGLTNPEMLKGALQPGSNTRQRLTAMGVPQDMQDMVIQYAMQNTQFQRETGTKAMYDPSKEADRKTMGIEESYAVQHEKTTGERIKREEGFYGRQVDNFARFEKNLRLSTQMLAKFEDALSTIIGLQISTKGHPATQFFRRVISVGAPIGAQAILNAVSPGPDADIGGDADVRGGSQIGSSPLDAPSPIKKSDMAKLRNLNPKLGYPLERMLAENPKLYLGDTVRSAEQQEDSFRERYRPTNKPLEEKGPDDRIWQGKVWEPTKTGPPMAAPGTSMHEVGLAADVAGDPEWVRANAARFGLTHGGTTKGAWNDEPFHVEPAGARRNTGAATTNKTSVTKTSAKVSSSSAAKVRGYRPAPSTSKQTPGQYGSSPNAGAMASAAERIGLRGLVGSVVGNTDKPINLGLGSASITTGGDASIDGPMGSMPGVSGVSGSSPFSIVVSPNVYIQGTSDMSSDLRRMAREVGSILEHEVKLAMMRST